MYKTTEIKLKSVSFRMPNYEKDMQTEIEQHLNEISKDGWTLVNMSISPPGLPYSVIFVWKKES